MEVLSDQITPLLTEVLEIDTALFMLRVQRLRREPLAESGKAKKKWRGQKKKRLLWVLA